MPPVKIYTTTTCGYCKMAKAFFKEHNVSYEEFDVGVDMEARKRMHEKSGQFGVPVIEIGENVVVGYDEEHIAELLGVTPQ